MKINFFIVFKLENYQGVRILWNKKNDKVVFINAFPGVDKSMVSVSPFIVISMESPLWLFEHPLRYQAK